MYVVNCSYDYRDFVKPWKVTLTEPYRGTVQEVQRVETDEEVIALIKDYKEKYGEKLITAEQVYMGSPRLDLVHIYE